MHLQKCNKLQPNEIIFCFVSLLTPVVSYFFEAICCLKKKDKKKELIKARFKEISLENPSTRQRETKTKRKKIQATFLQKKIQEKILLQKVFT